MIRPGEQKRHSKPNRCYVHHQQRKRFQPLTPDILTRNGTSRLIERAAKAGACLPGTHADLKRLLVLLQIVMAAYSEELDPMNHAIGHFQIVVHQADLAESARGISPQAAHRTVRKSLDLHGSCHSLRAAALRHNHSVPPVAS